VDWKREIAIAHLVKQKVAEADIAGIWKHPFPEVAATEWSVSKAESELGFELNEEIRDFLLHADGWNSFFHSVDVFGVKDFLAGFRYDRAMELLKSLEDVQDVCGLEISELLPFAVSAEDIDVFVMSKPNTASPGKVFWLAGGLVEEFSDFNEWFLTMVDHNREQYQELMKKNDLA
jgi:hypothetical protein